MPETVKSIQVIESINQLIDRSIFVSNSSPFPTCQFCTLVTMKASNMKV